MTSSQTKNKSQNPSSSSCCGSAMPNIQNLPRGFDIGNLNGLDKNNARARTQARMLQRGQGDRNGNINETKKKQKMQPQIIETIEDKWYIQSDINDFALKCIAKGMDPAEISIHQLTVVSGENDNDRKHKGEASMHTFHTIKFASGNAVLKNTGWDENGAFVLAYPTINFDNFVISLTSSDSDTSSQTDLGCVLSIDEVNSDLPIYKFNHKRLEKTLKQWVIAGAQCKFIDDSVLQDADQRFRKSVEGGDRANLNITCTVKKTVICASPLSSVLQL